MLVVRCKLLFSGSYQSGKHTAGHCDCACKAWKTLVPLTACPHCATEEVFVVQLRTGLELGAAIHTRDEWGQWQNPTNFSGCPLFAF